nr:CDP-glucose 4,6-dehydratase [Hyphomonas sp. Mor2]
MMPSAEFWHGKRVLVTGHTGFKGAWLVTWLSAMGAEVCGYSLAPEGERNLWVDLDIEDRVQSVIGDINDTAKLHQIFEQFQPEVIFHLAAQSLVLRSYDNPIETFASNVLGIVSLLDVVRRHACISAVVIATSDKCYDNQELDKPFTEEDRFGGRDPYSASKGCAEITAASMRMSFFQPHVADGHPAQIATVRAGNVIGGGDWSDNRIIPDIIRGCLGPDKKAIIRSPASIRPWQHVLEPLCGYVLLAEKLCEASADYSDGWNFGPGTVSEQPVLNLAENLVSALGTGELVVQANPNAPHEAKFLRLDASKATSELDWHPVLDFDQTVALTAEWYARWAKGEPVRSITEQQIHGYHASSGQ